jgi:bifunctional DNA-binding transcriptional regulator/antitoxin component of YhaV-PrlF toxin-antitoxin module
MTTLTVTAKGQVTLRKELLEHLGVEPGEKVVVDLLPQARAEVRSAKASGSIEDFIGCIRGSDTPKLSLAEMSETAAEAWAKDR